MSALREELARYAHEAWCDYMAWHLSGLIEQGDGSLIVPAGYVLALKRQITTPYAHLSPDDQDKDRAEANKMIAIMEANRP